MKQKAKKKVLQALKQKMRNAGNEDLMSRGISATVTAKDKKSLAEGLEKAQEIAESDELPEPEEVEEVVEEGEHSELSKEEILEKIEMLQSLLEDKE